MVSRQMMLPPPHGLMYTFDAERYRRFVGRPALTHDALRTIAISNLPVAQLFVQLEPYVIREEEW